MPGYRRWRVEGGVYFFTVVTHERQPVFAVERARRILREAMIAVRQRRPFEQLAVVLLKDHLHMLWRLPIGDTDYSGRIGAAKAAFTRAYLSAGGMEGASTPGRRRQRYRGVWQKRFMEHTIRDFKDFRRHLDYIHANPVKHGYVQTPGEWKWSSFHRYVNNGWYESDWCGSIEVFGGSYLEP